MVVEVVLTGCIDCGVVKAMGRTDIKEDNADFDYANTVRMWNDPDEKHSLILVTGHPQRVFYSCQPMSKLRTEWGVAAILNFVENIQKGAEETI